MRSHNKILAVAITTALSASFSNLYAKQQFITDCITAGTTPTQFENVGEGAKWATCIIGKAGEALLDPSTTGVPLKRPNNVFDFTAGESVIFTGVDQTAGLSYAAELFGGTGLVLPTPITTGSTPDYLGVIYTIDGKIPTDFEATFTLDNGATFAVSPILGVRDDKGDGIGTLMADVAASATAANITSSTLGVDSIFRFENHSNVYLSTVGAGAGFYRLGVLSSTSAPSVIGAVQAVGSLAYPKVYGKVSTDVLAMGYVKNTPVATIGTLGAAGSASPATVNLATPADANKFISGWTYACVSSGTGTEHLFTVSSQSATAGTMLLTINPSIGSEWQTGKWAASAGAFAAGECAAGGSIYRIHMKGDTVISYDGVTTTGFVKDQTYTFDIGNATTRCNLADVTAPTQYKITTVDTATVPAPSIIIQNLSGGTGLATPLCSSTRAFKTDISLSDEWNTSGLMTPKPPIVSAASGKPAASFVMNATKTNLEGGDQLMLLYKMSNVGVLADPTQKINMTIDLKTGGALDTIVNPQRTVTVATSAKALDVSLASLEAGKLNISVSSGSTQFSGDIAPSTAIFYGYVNNTTARIGQLKFTIKTPAPKMADAVTGFALASDKVAADSSKLVITGGQFQASKSIPGSVELRLYDSAGTAGSSITSDEITMDLEGAWQATWNLDSTDLSSIAGSANGAMIEMVVDGASEVNSVENPPVGNLTIDFNNTSYKDINIEAVELRKITKDGNVCTVYNVPPPSNGVMGADVVSIRVTNDSAIAGKLMGKFFGMDGTLMWSGDLMAEELQPGVTARLENDGLAKLMGITWEGRGVLQISSTIPEMEVMALIRQNGIKFAPLSNLSTGARGTSCTQQ